MVKNPPANAGNSGDASSIAGLGRSPEVSNSNQLQFFLPEKFHGQRSLAGYSLWGHKESDMTERLTHNLLKCSLMCSMQTLGVTNGDEEVAPLLAYTINLWHPTTVLLPGQSHGQQSLVGCSPWGH